MTRPIRTRIKICGIRTPEVARAAVDAGADAVGLVFVPGTPRALTPEEAEAILRVLPPLVEAVGLFVNASPSVVMETCRALGLRTLQLHGREAPAEAAALSPLRVIKALHFEAPGIARLPDWTPRDVPNLAAVLWDAPPPPKSFSQSSAQTGGHGKTIDWDALAMLFETQPATRPQAMMLAGGLSPANVAQAITTVRPYAVDVSSGVESSRGVKDVALIEAFCAAVRRADAS